MYGAERRSLILESLEREGNVNVNLLASQFSTSRETIRRDLRDMEAAGILKRTYGGAVLTSSNRSDGYEYPLQVREVQHYEEKQRICKAAASFVEDGDMIFLDNSSTTIGLLRYVPRDIKFSVLTNSIQIMLEAGELNNSNIVVIGLGGIFNAKNYSLTGLLSKSCAENFFPDKAFMSCRGVDERSGMTDASILEIEVKRNMLSRSRQFILLADYSKFGLIGAVHMGSLDEVDVVVTDAKADPDKLKMFQDRKARIVIAE